MRKNLSPMYWDPDKVEAAVLGLLYLTLHDGARAWKTFDWDALNRLHAKGLIESPINKNKSVALTPAGLKAAERAAKAHLCTNSDETWNELKATPNIQYRSADGLKGVLCRSAIDRKYFFRIYQDGGGFEDYDLRHDELSVQIDIEAMAGLYRSTDSSTLDHSPEVLGIDGPDQNKSGPG